MAKLQVEFGADISELKDKLAEAQLLLEKLRKQKATDIKLGLDVKNLQTQINDAKASVRGLSTEVNRNASAMNNHSRATANGGNTLMQFSRIAQDAPFGIIGIGNNLTATAESFGHLSQSAGGAGNALKAVVSSLTGVGGILLAVSLVTTGLTLMAQKGLTIGDVFDKLTGNFDEATRAAQKMNAEIAGEAQSQISSMNALVAVSNNVNLSMQDRLLAVEKLQKQYPAYFGNLTNEQILNGNVSSAVKGVTQALIAKAKAAAQVNNIVKLAEEEEQIQSRIKNEIADIARGYKLTNKEAFDFAKAVFAGGDAFKLLEPYKRRAGFFDVANAVTLNKTLSSLNNELDVNRTKQDKLTKSINDSTSAYIKLEQSATKTNKATETIKAPKFKNLNPNFIGGTGFIGGGIVNPNSGINAPDLGVDEAAILAEEKTRAGLLLQEKLLQDFSGNAEAIIFGSLVDTFGQLGTAIGQALASGGNVFTTIGKTLLNGLGKFISEMGGLLIQYGTMAVVKGKLDLAMKKGGKFAVAAGVIAIGVGVAAKAVGAAMSAKANAGIAGGESAGGTGQRGSFASGADVSSPVSSVSSGGSFNNSGGTVVFEISGQKLIGVLNNTTQGNLRLGGSGLVG
jgi:hypothetical protein